MQSQSLLVAAPEPIPNQPDKQTNEQTVIVDLLNKSDLFSGGLERRHMGICSQKTLADIKYLQQFTKQRMIENSDEPFAEQSKGCKICRAIINEGDMSRVDQIVLAL